MIVSSLIGLVIPFVLIAEVFAGSLEPPGAPTPTMKTLDEIVPTWHQVLPAAQRFVLVMGSAAVLDKETGLVWEKNPSTTTVTWVDARGQCSAKTVGGRMGWRLPSLHELGSLTDPNNPGGFPPGHPFTSAQSNFYWSATSDAEVPTNAWGIGFHLARQGIGQKTTAQYYWCVRSGQSVGDGY